MTNSTEASEQTICDYYLEDVATFHTEAIGIQITNIALNAPTALAAAAGNLLVLISVWRTASLHSPSHVLLCSLALSDMTVGLVVQPLFVVFCVAKVLHLREAFCRSAFLLTLVGSTLGMVSLLTITAISLDRSLAIYLHLRYRELVTSKRVGLAIVGVWCLCGCVSLTMLWMRTTVLAFFYPGVVCFTLLFTSVAYYKIYRVASRHRAQIHALAQQVHAWQKESSVQFAQAKNSSLSMFLFSCLLLLFYAPYLCTAVVLAVKGTNELTSSAQELAWTFMLFNSSLNPFFYCWRLRDVRVAVLETLQRCFSWSSRRSSIGRDSSL